MTNFNKSQLEALDQLLDILTSPLPSPVAQTSKEDIKRFFLKGNDFFTSLVETIEDKKIYLYVDLRDSDEALYKIKDLCDLHGLTDSFHASEDQSVSEILQYFDTWLQAHKHRFLQHSDVDWGYAGIVLPQYMVERFIEIAASFDIHFEPGCNE